MKGYLPWLVVISQRIGESPLGSVGRPYLVTQAEEGKHARALARLPLDRGYDEAWLQDLLDHAPDLLPVEAVDDRVMPPLLSLGREISTPIGSIDNLFISQNGYVVLVETKLWRNPEARRSVIAQILEYASHIRSWRYSDLDQLWRRTHPGKPSLWESVNPEGFGEAEWIDRVNDFLSEGRLTLLVVGDGIRSEIEALARAFGAQPDFHYRLGLVELRLYSLEGGSVLVLPTTLAKTVEIERTVVRITYTREPKPGVAVVPEPVTKPGVRSVLSEEAFLSDLASIQGTGQRCARVASRILELLKQSDLGIEWQSAGFSVKTPDPARSGSMLSLAGVERRGKCGTYLPWLRDQLIRSWGVEAATEQVITAQRQLFLQLGARPSASGQQITTDLPLLEGREDELVGGLIKVSEIIRAIASGLQVST